MDRVPVSSSTIASIGYDASSMTLEIEFLKGGTCQYFDVPEAVYQELMAASSHGRYLHTTIKGVYRYAKL